MGHGKPSSAYSSSRRTHSYYCMSKKRSPKLSRPTCRSRAATRFICSQSRLRAASASSACGVCSKRTAACCHLLRRAPKASCFHPARCTTRKAHSLPLRSCRQPIHSKPNRLCSQPQQQQHCADQCKGWASSRRAPQHKTPPAHLRCQLRQRLVSLPQLRQRGRHLSLVWPAC